MTTMLTADELSAIKRDGMSRLRWERVRRGLTIRDVCREVGISSPSVLAYWETGETSPDPHYRFRVAMFYGLPDRDLFPRAYRERGGA
jgi:transcriptional regulator with XRE-family HTH domain